MRPPKKQGRPFSKRSASTPKLLPLLILAVGAYGLFALYTYRNPPSFDPQILGLPATPGQSAWPKPLRQAFDGASAGLESPQTRPDSLRRLGMLLQANGYLPQARSYYQHLIESQPGAAKAYYFLADTLQDYATLDQAIEHLNSVAALAPDYSNTFLKLGEIYFQLGRYTQAQTAYQKRLALQPNDPYGWIGLARCHMEARDWPKAERCLQAAIKSRVEFSTPYALIARVYGELGNQERRQWARAQAKLSTRYREADDPWLNELTALCYDPYRLKVLADIEVQSKRPDAAIPLLERSLSIQPDDADALIELGRIYGGKKQFAKAKPLFQKAYRVAPENEYAWNELSGVLINLKAFPEALQIAQQGVAALPASAALHNQLGIALKNSGQLAGAEAAYRKAIALDSANRPAIRNLGVLLDAQQDPEAVHWLERFIALRPDDQEIHALLGEQYLRLGNFDQALSHLLEARRYSLNTIDLIDNFISIAYMRRGNSQAKQGQLDAAIASYQQGAVADPKNAEILSNLGAIYASKRDFGNSLRYFKEYIALEPNAPIGYLNLGKSLYMQGDRSGARAILEKALRLYQTQGDQQGAAAARNILSRLP